MKSGFIDCKQCVHLVAHEVTTNVINRYTGEREKAIWYECDMHPFSAPVTVKYSCIYFGECGAEVSE